MKFKYIFDASMDNELYKLQTSVGMFRVDKTNTHLRIGDNKICVEIKLYDTPELQWLASNDVTVEMPLDIKEADDTVHLLKLSLTILKLYRNIQFIKLLDNSKYDCQIDEKTKKTIYINKYNYLFHGGTWYDEKVGAIPIDPSLKKLYDETKTRYTDPSAKPHLFDFRNKGLEDELTPIYNATSTWKEFADLLHKQYEPTTLCKKISPWYEYAVAILTDNRMLPEFWKIDITDINIPFTRVKEGGGRLSRKYNLPDTEVYLVSPSELYNKPL